MRSSDLVARRTTAEVVARLKVPCRGAGVPVTPRASTSLMLASVTTNSKPARSLTAMIKRSASTSSTRYGTLLSRSITANACFSQTCSP